MYSKKIKEFVEGGIKNKFYIGDGNPNANILFVGKESAILEGDRLGKQRYEENAINWKNNNFNLRTFKVHKKGDFSPSGEIFNEDHILYKSWGKNTWSKYQKLKNYIYESKHKKYHIDFLENVFTTEINDSPSKTTAKANKSNLNERKILFKNSEYIQGFPVIVLACSNYIRNIEGNKEIEDIFGVKYKDEFPKKIYSKTNWFYSHYSEDNSKLVIHTRQLSTNVRNELLEDMGKLIREHLISLNLLE